MAELAESIAARFEPRLRGALLKAFGAMRDRVPVDEVERALLERGVGGVMELLDGLEADLAPVREELGAAFAESGRAAIQLVPRGGVLDRAWRFDPFAPAAADHLRTYTLDLIRNIGHETREAARNSLQADLIAGRNPRDTARNFRSAVGLTPRQELAVRNYRGYLEGLDPTALKRALRDGRFDGTVRRAIRTRTPLSPEQVDRMVERYRERYVKYRAEVIARTEALRASSVGIREAVVQAVGDGAVTPDLRRHWVFTRDKRTRPDHRLVPGMNPDGVGIDEPYKTPGGPLLYPRDPNGSGSNTIQCRCAERYALPGKPKPAPSKRPKPKPKPKPEPKPEPVVPLKDRLRQEYEEKRRRADEGGLVGYELNAAKAAAVRARCDWARALDPDELVEAKAQVLGEMLVLPKKFTLDRYAERLRQAAGWVPFDVLEEMRAKGYTMTVRATGKAKFRSFARGRHSHVAHDETGETFAHELAHQVDAFLAGGKIRAAWTNAAYVTPGDREGYRAVFKKLRSSKKGTYTNGDGQFWEDNWIHNYEGRIYGDEGGADGVEFWSMNCQRYSAYKWRLREGYDAELAGRKRALDEARAKGDRLTANGLEANLRGLENEGREAWSARTSKWSTVRRKYPEMASMLEDWFGKDFIRRRDLLHL